MAFLRFTRDKRGYEHFSLVEPTTNRRGKSRSRLLYWYRTPPNVRVGREPFDESVRRALEMQNPGVQFDWRRIIETPIPSAETDRWRERRRAEKAEKAARRTEAAAAVPGKIDELVDSDENGEFEQTEEIDESQPREEMLSETAAFDADAEVESAAGLEAGDEDGSEALAGASGDSDRAAQTVAGGANPAGRRRRRRRGRRSRPASPPSTSSTLPSLPDSSESPAPAVSQSDIEAPSSEPERD